jgi:hypothetical protein
MAYASKQKEILLLKPDIVILQECSEKDIQASDAVFSHWVGSNPHKGLGVLGFEKHVYAIDSSYSAEYPWFIPLRIEDKKLNILGIWAHKKNQQERYIPITHRAIDHYKEFLEKDTAMIIGDFNSNTIWDKEHSGRSHSDLVEKLDQLHFKSMYHFQTQENQGSEKLFTLDMYRHRDKGYHIDYAFLSKDLLDTAQLIIPVRKKLLDLMRARVLTPWKTPLKKSRLVYVVIAWTGKREVITQALF